MLLAGDLSSYRDFLGMELNVLVKQAEMKSSEAKTIASAPGRHSGSSPNEKRR